VNKKEKDALKRVIDTMGRGTERPLPGGIPLDPARWPARQATVSGPFMAGLPPTSTQAFMPMMPQAPSAMMSTTAAQAHMVTGNSTSSTAVQPASAEASQGIRSMQQPLVKAEGTGGEKRSLFDVPEVVRYAASSNGPALMFEPDRRGPLVDTRSVKVESSDG